jgi:hypothetical protein
MTLTVRVDLGRTSDHQAGGSTGHQAAIGSDVGEHSLEGYSPLSADKRVDIDIERPVSCSNSSCDGEDAAQKTARRQGRHFKSEGRRTRREG